MCVRKRESKSKVERARKYIALQREISVSIFRAYEKVICIQETKAEKIQYRKKQQPRILFSTNIKARP